MRNNNDNMDAQLQGIAEQLKVSREELNELLVQILEEEKTKNVSPGSTLSTIMGICGGMSWTN